MLVAAPFPETGGGARRALEVISRFDGLFDEIDALELVVPPFSRILGVNWERALRKLSERNITINETSLRMLESEHVPLAPHEIRNYVREAVRRVSGRIVGVYSFHEWGRAVLTAKYAADLSRAPFTILLQLQPYYRSVFTQFLRYSKFSGNAAALRGVFEWLRRRYLYARVMRDVFFRGFVAVSEAPIVLAGLERARYRIPFPANAFEPTWLKARNLSEKEDYVVFFAQFMPEKGIYELPYALKIIRQKFPDMRLVICGRIYDKYRARFEALLRRIGVEDAIEIRGFVPREELIRTVARARAFLYPTHLDAYPLVLLESLAAGTPVVTYDIPAISLHYTTFPAVRVVKEGDVVALAKSAIDILSLPDEEYRSVIENPSLLEFLDVHSSWENVARADAQVVASLLWGG